MRLFAIVAISCLPICAISQTVDDGLNLEDGFSLTPNLDTDGFTDEGELIDDGLGEIEEIDQPDAAAGTGAVLRGLDRVSGELTDIEFTNQETQIFERLNVKLTECRFPVDNPSGDAYAFLVIDDGTGGKPIFEGWMVASSPALNALDHPRYDLWVLRCTTS